MVFSCNVSVPVRDWVPMENPAQWLDQHGVPPEAAVVVVDIDLTTAEAVGLGVRPDGSVDCVDGWCGQPPYRLHNLRPLLGAAVLRILRADFGDTGTVRDHITADVLSPVLLDEHRIVTEAEATEIDQACSSLEALSDAELLQAVTERTVEIPRFNDPRVTSIRERAQSLAEAEKHRVQREKAAAEQRARDEMAAWIVQHGSEHLRRLWAEGIECRKLYLRERVAVELPGWRFSSQVPGYYEKPSNPPLSALKLLDEARTLRPEARLVRWSIEHEHTEDCYCEECPEYDWTGYAVVDEWDDDEIVFGGPSADAPTNASSAEPEHSVA
jgi:hypothetical protein